VLRRRTGGKAIAHPGINWSTVELTKKGSARRLSASPWSPTRAA